MIEITSKDQCSGCHACAAICSKNCITMVPDEEGFLYPLVDTSQCINCGKCDKVCPIIHKWEPGNGMTTSAVAAINKDTDIRLRSSSGGIFTLIAEEIIKQGGVVFGAAFAEDFRSVHHICVDRKDDLVKLRGSKYVQSDICDTYKQAKSFLDKGMPVLFTGTPCQISGLYSFLGKPYENLYTQDLICHGVPSPMVWRKYVEERENKAASATQRMFFRHKKYGWKTYAVLFEFSNKTAYVKSLQEDSFMRAFLSNSCLRPSCYNCSFKTIQRQADITLADFWGIQYVLGDMDDNKGTSLVLTHSDNGKELFEKITDKIITRDVDIDTAKKYNSALVCSSKKPDNRDAYMNDIKTQQIDDLAEKYFPLSFKKKLIITMAKLGIYDKLVKIKAKIKR